MSFADKIRETTDKLKDKLKAEKERFSAHRDTEKSADLAAKAKDSVRSEARYETSEGERISNELRQKTESRAGEVKERFEKH